MFSGTKLLICAFTNIISTVDGVDDAAFDNLEQEVFELLAEKLSKMPDPDERHAYVEALIKGIAPDTQKKEIDRIIKDSESFSPIDDYINDEDVEDIMINNTSNIFVYKTSAGQSVKVPEMIQSRRELEKFLVKLRMYTTSALPNKKILDGHLPSGSRINSVDSPIGPDITIRNFKRTMLSIIDLVRFGEMSYQMAGRLWLYVDGLKVRPANLVIGGMPASGKTTLLNAMFSFFRSDERIIVIEDTYELNTETQENCVRLETSIDMDLQHLISNAMRMRPDMLIVGEVRGEEAKDMMTAMNIGKICMSTIHASNTRDVITRLENRPMSIEREVIPLIDSIIVVSQVRDRENNQVRKITQVSEISGIETKILLSDLYTYDYKTREGSDILPSITYREILSKVSGFSPADIIAEEQRRAKILEQLERMGIRDIRGINEFCKAYYDNPMRALKKINMEKLGTLY